MSTVWKIIRIVGLYVGSFIVCVLIAALTMEPLPGGIQVLFAMLVPVAVVRWYEAGRSARLVQDRGFQKQPVFDLSPRYKSDEVSGKRMPDKFEAELGHVAAKASEAVRLTLEQSRREAQKSGDARMTGSQRQSSSSKQQGWVPKGQAVTIAGRQIDGMIYVGPAPRLNSHGYGEKCRAYIDPSLSVAALGSDKRGDNLSYWPGYSSIPAVCRATYLDWLANGRRDGTVNPGYMFLYFYGLERRFLLDDPSDFEKQEIISEVQRLKHLFAHNYSAQRYLGEFLGIASIATLGGISPDDPDLKASILENRNWELPIALKMVIGTLVANGEPVDAEWMYLWFICHPEPSAKRSKRIVV